MSIAANQVLRSIPDAPQPTLAEALERLLACAQQGACPEAVLHDIRALMSDLGLLLR